MHRAELCRGPNSGGQLQARQYRTCRCCREGGRYERKGTTTCKGHGDGNQETKHRRCDFLSGEHREMQLLLSQHPKWKADGPEWKRQTQPPQHGQQICLPKGMRERPRSEREHQPEATGNAQIQPVDRGHGSSVGAGKVHQGTTQAEVGAQRGNCHHHSSQRHQSKIMRQQQARQNDGLQHLQCRTSHRRQRGPAGRGKRCLAQTHGLIAVTK